MRYYLPVDSRRRGRVRLSPPYQALVCLNSDEQCLHAAEKSGRRRVIQTSAEPDRFAHRTDRRHVNALIHRRLASGHANDVRLNVYDFLLAPRRHIANRFLRRALGN